MISIFSFHRVHPERDNIWDPVSPKLFEKIIKYIKSNFEVQNLENILSNINLYKHSKKIACIVFDDGYKDNFEFALPILHKFDINASFYIVTDCIDKQVLTWTHQLAYIFQNTKRTTIDLKICSFIPLELQNINLETDNHRIAYAQKMKKVLKSVSSEDCKQVIELIQNQCDDVEVETEIMMNWNNIRELSSLGHIIGSHTVSHSMLGNITNNELIKHELTYSAKRITDETSKFPLTISYPVGSYNENVIKLAKEAGYSFGLAVNQKQYNPFIDDIFAIPRIELYNESWLKTMLRINGSLEFIKKLLKK